MTDRTKPLRWKQIMPNADRGWVLRRGDVVLGRVTPSQSKLSQRVTGWTWTAGLDGTVHASGYVHDVGGHGEAKRQCLTWVKSASGMPQRADG